MNDDLIRRLRPSKRTKGETAQLAAQLAPREELNRQSAMAQTRPATVNGGANQELGAIVIDNTPASLSEDITDVRRGRTFAGMEPVVLVILCFMVGFICFIAWQISQMPINE